MEPASSQESCSWEGTVCFQMDRGNPGLSFGPLVARRWSRPSTPGSPDTCVRRQALLLSHHVSRHVRILEAPQVGPPLHSRSVSGSAGWWSSSHWPSVGVGAAARQAQGSGLRIRDSNENRTKHLGRVCVCVCACGVCVCGGGDISRRVRPTSPPQLGVRGGGVGRAASQRCRVASNPVMREAGSGLCVFTEPSQKLGSRCADSPPRAHT